MPEILRNSKISFGLEDRIIPIHSLHFSGMNLDPTAHWYHHQVG